MKVVAIIMALIMSCLFCYLTINQPGTGDQSTDDWYIGAPDVETLQPGCYIGADGMYVKVVDQSLRVNYHASRHYPGHACGLLYWGAWENWSLGDSTRPAVEVGPFVLLK